MKLEITFSADTGSVEDMRILRNLFKEESPKPLTPTAAPVEIPKVKYPKKRGQTEDIILKILKETDGLRASEFGKYTDIPEGTIGVHLPRLLKARKVEGSNSKPYVWYIRGENPNIAHALKNVPRGGVMK